MAELAAFSDRDIATRERLEDYAADRIITTPGGLQLQIAMVCDGAGGGEAGELAARLTARTIFEFLEVSPETSVPKLLVKAVEQANKAVYSELHGTGTSTVSLAAVHLNDGSLYGRLYIASVGNSRVYLMRAGRLARLNIDHTLANEYVYAGQMSNEEARELDDPHYVTRAMGIGANVSVDIGFYSERGRNFVNSRRAFRIGQSGMLLQEGDTIFAASDGLFPFVQDNEFLQHALDDDVERATRSLMKYAADRAPEDNTALSMLFVPSRSRKAVKAASLTRGQRAGISIFLLAIILVIGFLGLQVVSGENQRVAFQVTQTFVQNVIIESSYTHTPTPLPPTATPTQEVIIGQVGNRFSLTQAGIRVFNGKFIDPLAPPEINYVSVLGAAILQQGLTINPANLYLQPATSIRLNQVDDQSDNKNLNVTLGRGGDMFANIGDYQSGGMTIALAQNPDFLLHSENACAAARQILADSSEAQDSDKVALACYGGNQATCTYQIPGTDPVSVPAGKQALLDIDNLKLIEIQPITQAEVDAYRQMIWTLNKNPDQLSCLGNWLDEDKDGINYPLDLCPTDVGSVAAQGCPDGDNDGVPDTADQCPADVGPAQNNGCPLPDLDGDGLSGSDDACPVDAGPASNDGCPTEGIVATQYAATQTAQFHLPTATATVTATATSTPTPTITRTPTATWTPTATPIPPPDAVNDTFSALAGQILNQLAPGVLANDALRGGTLQTFSGSTTKGGTITLSGDGSFDYGPPPSFIGTDSFNYTLTNAQGSDSATVTINVLQPPPQPPTAGFTPNPSSGPAPLTVSFINTSTGPINSYSWDFGDGGTSQSPAPSHTYGTPGTYTVSLTVAGPGGTSSAVGSVTVSIPPPVACFSPTSTTILKGATVNFNSGCSNGNITGRSWTFSDGGSATGTTTSHTYPTAGAYTVTLTVTGPGGTDTTTGTVTVNEPPPTACFSPTTTTIAPGGSVGFNSGCSGGGPISGRSWTFGDGGTAGNVVSPNHTYATAGTYTVTLTVTGPGGTATATGTVNVVSPPTACFTPTTVNMATGGTANFTSCSSGNITGLSWTFGDGGTGAGTPVSHVYAAPGTFTVTLTATGPGGTGTATGTVNVATPPTAVGDTYTTTIGNALTVAAPGVLGNDTRNGATLTNTNPGNGALTFTTGGANAGAFTYTPAAGFAGPDSFTYTLTNVGGTSTATVNICVRPQANADTFNTTIGNALTIAAPGLLGNDTVNASTVLTAPATTANGTVAVGAAGDMTYTPSATFVGTDTFTYTLANGACNSTATVTINVDPVANGDSATVNIGGAVVINVVGNDNPNTGVTTTAGTAGAGTLTDNVPTDSTIGYTHTGTTGGTDTFTYTISINGRTSAPATVTVTILPVANADNATINIGGSVTINLIGNDNPNTGVTTAVGGAGAGTVTDNGDGTATYAHTGTTAGTDTFTYTITSGGQTSAAATVTVNILPIANADSGSVVINGSVIINLLGNDNPNTGVTLAIGGAGAGTVTDNGDGTATYTNTGGTPGTDSFTYTITSFGQTSNPATVTVNILPPPPVANGDGYSVASGGTLTIAAPGVLGNDTLNGGTAGLTTGTGSGALTFNADGSFTYVSAGAAGTTDFFTYTITNGGGSSTATVAITIT